MDKLFKKSKAFCEKIDKIQDEYIQDKREQKNNKDRNEKGKSKSEAQSPKLNREPLEDEDREPGEVNDAASSFYSLLYGRNSQLDPDSFINDVLSTIKNHTDLTKWFKRFLPDDDEEEEQSAIRRYWQFRSNLNLLNGDEELENGQMNQDMQSVDEVTMINQVKSDCSHSLTHLLGEYS